MACIDLKSQVNKPSIFIRVVKVFALLVVVLGISACDISPSDMKFRPADETVDQPQKCAEPPCPAKPKEKD
jgi:hypothetical protein